MEEVLTIRVPKGTRRRLEGSARRQGMTVSQYVRKALDVEQLLDAYAVARADLIPRARKRGIYTEEDVFALIS
jgi:predicted DNA-binding protein